MFELLAWVCEAGTRRFPEAATRTTADALIRLGCVTRILKRKDFSLRTTDYGTRVFEFAHRVRAAPSYPPRGRPSATAGERYIDAMRMTVPGSFGSGRQ
jgi:hypothetical protein